MSAIDRNRAAWNERAKRRERHTRTASAKDLENPMRWLDPEKWVGPDLISQNVLCLGAGGGMQSALCAAAGGQVTVVDISREMLELDARVAAKYNFALRLIDTTMEDLSMLGDASFDLVMQPVSTCYVPDVRPVFREVARVLKAGGLYISQHKQPVNLQASALSSNGLYSVVEPYYRSGALPPEAVDAPHREAGTTEFLHTWESLIGQMCRAGFVIEDLAEPRHDNAHAPDGSFEHRSRFIPPYVKIRARRLQAKSPPQLWTP